MPNFERIFGAKPHQDTSRLVEKGQELAAYFQRSHLGTEHLLSAYPLTRAGVALLRELDILFEGNEQTLIRLPSDRLAPGFTPIAKTAIHLAVDTARRLNHPEIGIDHVLFGVHVAGGEASSALQTLGVDYDQILSHIINSRNKKISP